MRSGAMPATRFCNASSSASLMSAGSCVSQIAAYRLSAAYTDSAPVARQSEPNASRTGR